MHEFFTTVFKLAVLAAAVGSISLLVGIFFGQAEKGVEEFNIFDWLGLQGLRWLAMSIITVPVSFIFL